jgi:hypothetical protein
MSTEDIVRWLRDRDLIKDLLVRYAHAVDGGDWTTVRSCFAVDAVVAGILVREPIGPYLEALEASVAPYERTMHFIGSQLVKLSPAQMWHGSRRMRSPITSRPPRVAGNNSSSAWSTGTP